MFKSMGRFFIIALSFLLLINLAHAGFRAPPIPARIGGTVSVDGTQLTQASAGTTYTFKVTRTDGTDFLDVNDNPAEDTDGLSANGWYLLDIPMYDATDQPNGANAGDQAVIHVYKDGTELTVTNPAGGAFLVDESGANTQMDLQVTSALPPVADFSADPISGAAPLEVQFTDNSTGDITSRSWDFGDGQTSTETNPIHTYQKAGRYTVELTVTGPGGSDAEAKTDYITAKSSAPWLGLLLAD